MNGTWENASADEILADLSELAKIASVGAPREVITTAQQAEAMGYPLPPAPRLTWRAIPEPLPGAEGALGGTREVWWGAVGGRWRFMIVPRPLLGGVRHPGVDNGEPCTWDLYTLEPVGSGAMAHALEASHAGNWVELVGAQARARRILRGRP